MSHLTASQPVQNPTEIPKLKRWIYERFWSIDSQVQKEIILLHAAQW
jgi:hypothetical protein